MLQAAQERYSNKHVLFLGLVIQGTTLFLFVTLRRTGAPELRMKDTVAVTYTREKGCFCSVSSRHLYSTFRSKSRQTVNPVRFHFNKCCCAWKIGSPFTSCTGYCVNVNILC